MNLRSDWLTRSTRTAAGSDDPHAGRVKDADMPRLPRANRAAKHP